MQLAGMDPSLCPAVLRSPRPRARARTARSPLRALCAALQRQAAAAGSRTDRCGVDGVPAVLHTLQLTAEAALRAAAALAAALALHLGAPEAAHASAAEDALLQLVRQVEAKVDGAVGAMRDAASLVSAAPAEVGALSRHMRLAALCSARLPPPVCLPPLLAGRVRQPRGCGGCS